MECAADLDELAARNDHLAPAGERRQREQHGRRVVVHHRRGLGPGELAQQAFDDAVAVAAPARDQIELQVVGRGHHLGDVRDGGFGQQRAPEVGVQHRAREVEHGAHAWRQALVHAPRQGIGQRIVRQRVHAQATSDGPRTQLGQQRARRLGHQRVAMRQGQRLHGRQAQKTIERRQILRPGGVRWLGFSRRTVNHGFFRQQHQEASGSASGSPKSSSMLVPLRT